MKIQDLIELKKKNEKSWLNGIEKNYLIKELKGGLKNYVTNKS